MENYLEKIFTEYLEYKNFLKSIIKPIETLRAEVAQKITADTSEEDVIDIVLQNMETIRLHQIDFSYQQQRLFHTVEAFKGSMEIPKEILVEIEGLEFMQIFSIKLGEAKVIKQEAIDYAREQIKSEIQVGIKEFTKRHL